jgi:hypothetical protein
MTIVKEGTRVLCDWSPANLQNRVKFETAFPLREDITSELERGVEGVNHARQLGRYEVEVSIASLFSVSEVVNNLIAFLCKLDPRQKAVPASQNRPILVITDDWFGNPVFFGSSAGICCHSRQGRPAPRTYEEQATLFSQKLANDYVKRGGHPVAPLPTKPLPSPFLFDPALLGRSQYCLGVDSIGYGLDFNLNKDSVHVLHSTYGPSPITEFLKTHSVREPKKSLRDEFQALWKDLMFGPPSAVPPVEWKELCVVNGFIIQTATAYPHRFRVILAPDTDFLAPSARRFYLGQLAHLINGDKLIPQGIQVAIVGLVDLCVTLRLKPTATSSNMEMVGYLVRKISEVVSPYSIGPAKSTVGGDDTLMAMGYSISSMLRKSAPTAEGGVPSEKDTAPQEPTPAAPDDMIGGALQAENKKKPRKVTSIATCKNTRVLIGVSEEHRLVVIVDKHKVPTSISEDYLPRFTGTLVNKPNVALIEGKTVAHAYLLAKALLSLYEKAPGIVGKPHTACISDTQERLTNPDLKEALSNHILENAGKVSLNTIYQFNGPTPPPAPLPQPRYVAVRHVCQLGYHEHTFELQVMSGPKFSLPTINRALYDCNQQNVIGKEGQFVIKAVTASDRLVHLTVCTVGPYSIKSETVASDLVAHLKKFGLKSDQNDRYNLVRPL